MSLVVEKKKFSSSPSFLENLKLRSMFRFDKEGVMFVREKQEGFFRRAESKSICIDSLWWFLKSNFYIWLNIEFFNRNYVDKNFVVSSFS